MAYSYHNPGGQNEFGRLAQVIGTNIQKISQNVSSVEKWVNQIGTLQDSEQLRTQLHQIQHYTNQLAKDTNKHLKDLSTIQMPTNLSEQKQRKMQKERLTNEFAEALKNFQECQRKAAQKEKESVKRARANSGLDNDPFFEGYAARGTANRGGKDTQLVDLASPSSAVGPSQSEMQIQMEEEVNVEALKERENAIKQLESDIVDVNTIFKDLATMVHDQGDVIDSIEANMDNAQISVQDATKQLGKARQSQSSARKKKFILLLIVIIVLAIITSIIIYKTTAK